MSTNEEDVENQPTTSYSLMIFDSLGRIRPCQNQIEPRQPFIHKNHDVFIYNPSTISTNNETFTKINSEMNSYLPGTTREKLKLLCNVTLEDNVNQVRESLKLGCFCVKKNCLNNLDAELVYLHRSQLSKLDRAEHNMFLMGALVTCVSNIKGIKKSVYVKYTYNNKRVCKEAFLYLNLCTYQQLADVREHLQSQGVSKLSLQEERSKKQERYYRSFYDTVKQFLSHYLKVFVGGTIDISSEVSIPLPFEATKKNVYDAYKEYVEENCPGQHRLSYVMFKEYLKKYFPQVVFYRFGARSGRKPKPLGTSQWVNDVDLRNVQVVSPFTVIPPHRGFGSCATVEVSSTITSGEMIDE